MRDYDICIVGAGLAGLYCAREINTHDPDLKIAILEKYKSIGGRAITFRKTIPGHGSVHWEAGAGRIHESHTHIINLLKEYELQLIPISGTLSWKEAGVPLEPNDFSGFIKTLPSLEDISQKSLRSNTLKSLFELLFGKATSKKILDRYEYRSEIDTMRSDKGLYSLFHELGDHSGFSIIKEGFSALIGSLRQDIETTGTVKILRDHQAVDIESHGSKNYHILIKDRPTIRAGKVIIALDRDSVSTLGCFKDHYLLRQVSMRPLVRMYAVFPKTKGGMWFTGLTNFVCAPPIRYVIPIDPERGIIMITYTDGKDAEYWLRKIEEYGDNSETNIEAEVMEHIRKLFPTLTIPDPVFFKIHPWKGGCSYWVPGNYDIKKASYAAIQPFPDKMPGVYMCGESWAENQMWANSAIEHAELVLKELIRPD